MNILVVDDDEMVRYVLTEKLCETGFTATAAADGRTAIQLFHEMKFDAVLLDLKMPGMDGIETLKELRGHDPDIPVIMVTAFGDISTAVETIKLGAYDFVEKPPQISRIMVTLRRAIEKAALEREIKSLGKSVEESALLKLSYLKLKELDQVKMTFLSSISHELRTPLTSIVGYADISRKKIARLMSGIIADDPKNTTRLQEVESNMGFLVSESEKLAGLIESILDLTAMEAGTVEWKWEPFSFGEAVENSARDFLTKFRNKGIDCVIEIEGGLPAVKGDRNRICQVVKNLLSNAEAFTEHGVVTCSVRRINNEILLRVTDTGMGITESDCAIIFEKFSQIGDTLTAKPKGVGLGLPICRLIVGYHGGKISVSSEPGKGSEFTVILPLEEGISG